MAPNEDEVEVFDRDAAAGGYVYARGDRVSSTLTNARLTEAILAAADFRGRRVIDLLRGRNLHRDAADRRWRRLRSWYWTLPPHQFRRLKIKPDGSSCVIFAMGGIMDPKPGAEDH